jgi:hypothetical protein
MTAASIVNSIETIIRTHCVYYQRESVGAQLLTNTILNRKILKSRDTSFAFQKISKHFKGFF